jgi:hypothetical protein
MEASAVQTTQPRSLADLLRSSITAIWFVLIGATLLSWWLGTDHVIDDASLAGALILLVAFIKVRFVGLYFMELRHAPIPLRLVWEGWCLVVCTTVVIMFVVA